MAFYGYHDDTGKCHWTPYNNTSNYYNVVSPPQTTLPTYHPYESSVPQYVDYQSPYTHSGYDYNPGLNPEMNFYRHSFSENQLIQYEPAPYETAYVSSTSISYSVSYPTKKVRFTLPEFDEYDPTPYGGGYDTSEVYGKPLPPSDTVCFPRSVPPASRDVSLEGFSYDSIPRPYGKHDEKPTSVKPQNGEMKQGDSIIDVAESSIEDEDSTSDDDDDDDDDDGIDLHEDEKNKEIENVGIESNIQVLHIPYGSGLEAVDICESIFGYWPCVDKMNRELNRNAGVSNEESYNDQWKSAAEYLFGSPFGYGEPKDGGHYAFEYGSNYNYHGEYGRK